MTSNGVPDLPSHDCAQLPSAERGSSRAWNGWQPPLRPDKHGVGLVERAHGPHFRVRVEFRLAAPQSPGAP